MESSSNTGHSSLKKISFAGLLVTLGIIYGDIGTSPLYVFRSIIGDRQISETLVYGGISCVIWTLTLQTTFKYVFLTLQADNRGEGGIFSLYALVRRYAKWLYIPAIIGASAAMALSGIPFFGPLGAARVGYINEAYVLNPTATQLADTQLDLVVAATETAVMMVESEAQELSEEVMLGAVVYGHEQMQSVIKMINEM